MTAVAPDDHVRAERDTLGRQVRRGLGWSSAANIAGRLGTLLSGVILARLLQPHDYGQFTVALVALVILANVNDLGLEQAIVRWRGDVDRVLPTAVTLIAASSAVLFAGFFALAPAFAAGLGSSGSTGIVRLLCVGILINGAFAVPSALLTRSFLQGRRAAADLSGFAFGTGLTIALAAAGMGAWSLAWGRLAGNGVNGVLHFALAPARPRPGWSTPAARELIGLGLPIAGALLLAVAMLNVDYVVVGGVLGPVALGLYVLAFNLSSWPVNVFSIAVARVSVAAFAQLQDDARALSDAFARSLGMLMTLTVPVCVVLATLCAPVVRVVYGPRWEPAADALRLLAVFGGARVGLAFCHDLILGAGRPRATLFLHALWLAALAPAMLIGVHAGGIAGAGAAHVAVALGVVTPVCGIAMRGLGIDVRRVGAVLTRPLLGGLVAAGASLVAVRPMPGSLGQLTVGGVALVSVYAAVVLPRSRLLPAGWMQRLPLRRNARAAAAAG